MKKSKNGFTRSKNPDSKRFKRDMARHLDGRSLKCVTEKIDGVEEIVGRGGAIAVRDDELIVLGGQDVVLRTKILSMNAWELMSLEGVVITAPDEEHGGVERTIVAYYSYWRTLED
ncbi:MAG: hypothetical protein II736_00485 [Clostridia bacterium]|nr:hypothetical protein [Clostridia bacterium]